MALGDHMPTRDEKLEQITAAQVSTDMLRRFLSSNGDARKIDPRPLLVLALAGARARGGTLVPQLSMCVAFYADAEEAKRAEARAELVRQEALEDREPLDPEERVLGHLAPFEDGKPIKFSHGPDGCRLVQDTDPVGEEARDLFDE